MYLLVGSGRLARHLHFYFDSLHIPHLRWSRRDEVSIESLLRDVQKVLFLIKDDQIEVLRHQHDFKGKTLIHCSGALEIDGLESAHPLCSFAESLYEPSFYKRIPFVTVQGKMPFS